MVGQKSPGLHFDIPWLQFLFKPNFIFGPLQMGPLKKHLIGKKVWNRFLCVKSWIWISQILCHFVLFLQMTSSYDQTKKILITGKAISILTYFFPILTWKMMEMMPMLPIHYQLLVKWASMGLPSPPRHLLSKIMHLLSRCTGTLKISEKGAYEVI